MHYNPEELDEILTIFKSESEEIIQALNDGFLVLEKNPEDKTPLKKLFQLCHSLKGASRMLGFNSIQDIAHKLEDILAYWKKDDVVISVNIFQEIYQVCDLLGLLISRCAESKADYSNEQVLEFITKLDNFITFNHMIPVEKQLPQEDKYISEKSVDINALILELMFILEREDNDEDIIPIVKDIFSQIDEIFNITKFDDIKFKINELIDAVNNNFDIVALKPKVLELRNDIYNLYKKLNIKPASVPEKKKEIKKEETKPKENINTKELSAKFDFIIQNLQRIKQEKESIKIIITSLEEVIKLSQNQKIELILSKTIDILKLFNNKNIVLDNECYMVILQCIYLAKRISLNEKDENINNLTFLVQRLNVVEDMFSIPKVPVGKQEQNSLIAQNDYDKLKKNLKSFDLEEIKVLRVDTGKIDNLIAQTGELLINGIKTREHIVELSKINSKITQWSSTSKKIMNYLKYLEKRGFFSNEADESSLAFYKKAQGFFEDNANMINELNKDFNQLYNIISEDDNKLHQTALEIETIAKGMRVLPLATIFHSFPRMIRDIAKEKNKKIDFIVAGSDTTVDKKIIEEIKMPLIHIIRNSVSHGIEEPETRMKNGKKETGRIKLTAKQAENHVIITIEDDGYGINLEKVKATAIDKGMLSKEEAESMTDEQLMRLLFIPGFSTEDSVSEISGRGIGLDVVKTKITNLNGELLIDSELNKGCTVTIKLPVSMSTIKTFVITVNEQKYAIPVNSIKYVKQIKKEEIFRKAGQDCIIFDGHSVPVYSLSNIFEEPSKNIINNNIYTVIIIETGEKQAAYITDKLLGDQEVFLKKLMPPVLKIKNISGFTTLSTGEICLIINPFELIRNTFDNNMTSLFDMKQAEIEEKSKKRKILILDDNSEFMKKIQEDVCSRFQLVNIFDSINSVYDHVLKNEVDILICKINHFDDEVIRLIKYLKTDENFNNIKLIILSDISEYEIIRSEKDFSYSLYQKTTEYQKDKFIEDILRF